MKKHSLMITAAALAAAMVLGTGCAKKPAVETSETVTSQASAEETTKAPETTAKAPETTEQAAEAKEVYHMLQGTVTKVTADGRCSPFRRTTARTMISASPTSGTWRWRLRRMCRLAIAYIGEPLGSPEDVTLVVALPEQEEWSILTEKGTTTANAMSSFTMETDDGQELSFLKDNCPD